MRLRHKSGVFPSTALFLSAMVLAPGGALFAQKTDSPPNNTNGSANQRTSNADMKWAKDAARGGMLEVQLGQLAVQKALSEKVKMFGQRMIDDHTKLNDQLQKAAAKDNITLPTQIDAKEQGVVTKLSALSGTQFDRAYMKDMVKDHEHDITEFQKQADNGTNPDLKNAAMQALPTLQEHLTLARDTENSLNVTSRK